MIDSDFDTLDKLLGDDLIYTHSSAQFDTRTEDLALCKKGVFKYLKSNAQSKTSRSMATQLW
jgi:hypothetical protein